MRQNYSEEFKKAILEKVLNRESLSIREVAEKEGVGRSTVNNWLRACGKVAGMNNPATKKMWTAEAKLKSLHEVNGLGEAELGAYVRREGLYTHQLAEWRKDAIESLGEARRKPRALRDGRDDRIKELEHYLARMEKALAEASARMMLEKKADLFWSAREAAKK